MRVFGYDNTTCSHYTDSYHPISYIGFAIGTVYQYGLLRLMVLEVFANVENVPKYSFDHKTFFIILAIFVILYEFVMHLYSVIIKKLSIKSIMLE